MRLKIEPKGLDNEDSIFNLHWDTGDEAEPVIADDWTLFNIIKYAVDNRRMEFEIPGAYINNEFGCEVKWLEFPKYINDKIEELRRNQH